MGRTEKPTERLQAAGFVTAPSSVGTDADPRTACAAGHRPGEWSAEWMEKFALKRFDRAGVVRDVRYAINQELRLIGPLNSSSDAATHIHCSATFRNPYKTFFPFGHCV